VHKNSADKEELQRLPWNFIRNCFLIQASSPYLTEVVATRKRVRIMAGSPSHPPYPSAGSGPSNDSGLDLALDKENPRLGSSHVGEGGPPDTNVESTETESLVSAEHEAS
jgi:hypothetical protein